MPASPQPFPTGERTARRIIDEVVNEMGDREVWLGAGYAADDLLQSKIAAVIDKPTGEWRWMPGSRKSHYFVPQSSVSACGVWSNDGGTRAMQESDDTAVGAENCLKCWRRAVHRGYFRG